MLASMATVYGQTCGGTDSFTISSNNYPGSEGCYSYSGISDDGNQIFTSSQGVSSIVTVFESISYPGDEQYYLFFYRDDGETVLCASTELISSLDHPVDIQDEGWEFCYIDGVSYDVSNGEIDVTCGCDTDEESVDPIETNEDLEEEKEIIGEIKGEEGISTSSKVLISIGAIVFAACIIATFLCVKRRNRINGEFREAVKNRAAVRDVPDNYVPGLHGIERPLPAIPAIAMPVPGVCGGFPVRGLPEIPPRVYDRPLPSAPNHEVIQNAVLVLDEYSKC